jgi:hypothetical protein
LNMTAINKYKDLTNNNITLINFNYGTGNT